MNAYIRTPIPFVFAISLVAGCSLLTDPPDPPGAPSGVGAEAQSRSEILVTWTAPGGGMGGPVERLEIERVAGSGTFTPVEELDADATSFTDSGLESETRYRYQLRACNEGGCSEYSGGAAATTFGTLEVTTTQLPTGAVGQPYSGAVTAGGAGSSYQWTVTSGSLPAGLVLEGTSGIISGTPTSEQTSQFTVQAQSVDGQTATADLSITIGAPLPVEILNATLPPGLVQGPYETTLRTSGGSASVTWSLAAGALPPGLALDPAGTISGTPTASDTVTLTLRAESAGNSDEKDLILQVVENRPNSYNITTVNVVPVDPSIQPHVDSAVARWERVITADLQPVSIPAGQLSPSSCSGFGEALDGTALDDLIALVNIAPIDGPGNTLAQAGPCLIRTGGDNPNLSVAGVLTLDEDDLLPLTGTETLTALVFHELGHVLGFGTLWNLLGLVSGADSNQPQFTGNEAVAEYQNLGQPGDVPLENQGGAGTAGVHWREAVFDTEVMTGFSESVGVPQPLSRVTIASMEDLGYTADRSEADPFTLAMALAGGGADGALGYDVVLDEPLFLVHPDGTVRPAAENR